MKIRCLMMFKNEDDLLTSWVRHHGALFGLANLFLFDNGSTSAGTIEQIGALVAQGVSIDRTHRDGTAFIGKGDLFASIIHQMDEVDPADFYLPLDCDEFVGVENEGGVSFRGEDIRSALAPYLGNRKALGTAMAYQNLPGSPGLFRPAFGALTKTFFAQGACATLDHGFHHGTGRADGPPLTTPLVHVHYHNKPLTLLQAHSRQKLEAENANLSAEGVAARIETKGPGWHLLGYLGLRDDAQYHALFDDSFVIELPDFTRALRDVGCDLPFSKDSV